MAPCGTREAHARAARTYLLKVAVVLLVYFQRPRLHHFGRFFFKTISC
jgi:hypothetical protein